MLSGLWFTSFLVKLSSYLKVMKIEMWYSLSLFILIFVFAIVRFPYVYGMFDYGLCLIVLIMPLFISLFFSRLFCAFGLFVSSFIPVGCPIYLAPFVCIIGLISFIIRPVVLLVRPFVNISAGVYFGVFVGNLCFAINYFIFVIFFVLFVYEIFVALMHWFIVQEILKFSVDH
uniref:ATPase subunit 6 n=1 Tax=Schistosoma japonicum TaxID=6182 RepID=A0A0D3L3C5_SCHJA|nr:ATPase subunit 6 [Schistosoma japonicum]